MNNADVGETIEVNAKILKKKKNRVTVVEIDGERYVLEHKDNFKGGKK